MNIISSYKQFWFPKQMQVNSILRIVLLLVILMPVPLHSQVRFTQADIQLANEYYRNKEYAKAAVIYKQLHEQNSQVRSYYMFYVNCLWELQELEEAESVIKSAIKQDRNDLSYYVDLGYTYKRMGKEKKSEKTYEEALDKLDANRNHILNLAGRFNARREYSWAIRTYERGRQLLGNASMFRNELGNAYMMSRSYDLMIKEYLMWLGEGTENVQFIKNRLQSLLRVDVQDNIYEMIRETLIIELQNNPGSVPLSDLLVWLYTQKKEFRNAFLIAQSIDKRLNEDGIRIYQLAGMARANDEFEEAAEMFEYLVDKTPRSTYYYESKAQLLQLSFSLLRAGKHAAHQDPLALAVKYEAFFMEFGKNLKTAGAIIDYAVLQAYHLDKIEEAIQHLESVLELRGTSSDDFARAKLELADIHLYRRDRWEAAILYGQVEKENENNVWGHEAKLRKARLAYFTGDFRWAEAQLNILKASTSKLISNDAIDLANLIRQNTQDETSEAGLKEYAKGSFYQYKNQTDSARQVYLSLLDQYGETGLIDETLFQLAALSEQAGDYEQSLHYLDRILEFHSKDLLGDDASYRKGILLQEFLKDESAAMGAFEQLLLSYPSSIYAVDARKRYRNIREKVVPEAISPTN